MSGDTPIEILNRRNQIPRKTSTICDHVSPCLKSIFTKSPSKNLDKSPSKNLDIKYERTIRLRTRRNAITPRKHIPVKKRHRRRRIKRYVDNAMNRKLGRVGKRRGTHIVHRDGSVTIYRRRRRADFHRKKTKRRSKGLKSLRCPYRWSCQPKKYVKKPRRRTKNRRVLRTIALLH